MLIGVNDILSRITAKSKLIFVRIHLIKINLQPVSRC